jgi:hypothetical protein
MPTLAHAPAHRRRQDELVAELKQLLASTYKRGVDFRPSRAPCCGSKTAAAHDAHSLSQAQVSVPLTA